MDELMSEREQWEAVREWLRGNIGWLLGGIVIVAAGWSGYNWWHARREAQLLAASVSYEQLMAQFSGNDLAAAESKADELIRQHPGTGYADQAELALARLQVENGAADKALPRLEHVMNDSKDPQLRLLARLRVAQLQLDLKQPDQAMATLDAAQPGALAPNYAELRGDILYAKGDRAGALAAYQQAASSGSATLDGELLKLKINDLNRQ